MELIIANLITNISDDGSAIVLELQDPYDLNTPIIHKIPYSETEGLEMPKVGMYMAQKFESGSEKFFIDEDTLNSSYRLLGNNEGFNWATAHAVMKSGYGVRRKGWNGKGLTAYLQKEHYCAATNLTNLPEELKRKIIDSGKLAKIADRLVLVYPDNTIHQWVPSSNDLNAEDWILVKH